MPNYGPPPYPRAPLQFRPPGFVQPDDYRDVAAIPHGFDALMDAYARSKGLDLDRRRQRGADLLTYGAPLEEVTPEVVAQARQPVLPVTVGVGGVDDLADTHGVEPAIIAGLRGWLERTGRKDALRRLDERSKGGQIARTEAQTADIQSRTQSRRLRDLQREDEGTLRMAVGNLRRNPAFGTMSGEERRVAIEEEFELLRAIQEDDGGEEQPRATRPQREPAAYKSPEDVRAAVRSGALKQEDGMGILRRQFGYK